MQASKMVSVNTFIKDVFNFLKEDLLENITDPKSAERTKTSRFIMTSYPKRNVIYPLITLKIPNFEALRAGMQTTAMDILIPVEIRVWARNQKDKDTISNQVFDRLRLIQFSATGSIDNDLHDFNLVSAVEVDEEGERGIKSRILQVEYKFFNVN